jgi:hypothetical protein
MTGEFSTAAPSDLQGFGARVAVLVSKQPRSHLQGFYTALGRGNAPWPRRAWADGGATHDLVSAHRRVCRRPRRQTRPNIETGADDDDCSRGERAVSSPMRTAARRLPGASCGPACASPGRCSRPAGRRETAERVAKRASGADRARERFSANQPDGVRKQQRRVRRQPRAVRLVHRRAEAVVSQPRRDCRGRGNSITRAVAVAGQTDHACANVARLVSVGTDRPVALMGGLLPR